MNKIINEQPADELNNSGMRRMEESIGARIKAIRKLQGLTQEELGRIISRSAMFVSRVEKNRSRISLEQITVLADRLGVNESWLRDGSGSMTDHERSRDRRSIGERVFEIRRKTGLNQKDFAALLGVSRNTISLIERRKISASSAVIRSVAEKMDVDEFWLRSGEEFDLSFLDDPGRRKSAIAYLKRMYPEEFFAGADAEETR